MEMLQRRFSALGLREALSGIFDLVRQSYVPPTARAMSAQRLFLGLPNHAGCPPTERLL